MTIKTEHAGPKRGRGAYHGPKRDAKKDSKKLRRQADKREIREQLHRCLPCAP